ncbi:ATP-binding cassette domain-containing protein [Streptomyces sp. 549]|uniref:ABC transporter ATP-binding protein n=1 Tax=Streptomyces sp. 549 TaxID=3049076 RepID=UPI0024C2277F|nr:ATP-binding cassette domain-containing protein [Streptomyces sp. 549]MDK1472160.1 ATP-binding cassette domain-containing protein [Streptomyces sp. 549]
MDLDVQAGQSVAITGPSGSGKSTLLSCVLGLVRPEAGSVKVAGAEIAELSGHQLAEHRSANIGMVFQFGELLPELSPVDNVALAALLAGVDKEQAYEQASGLLQQLGVPGAESCQHLSGGERQRTAVARALINEPALLLADEPTGALDAGTRTKVADVLFSTPLRYGCGLLLVTHDAAVAARADHVLALRDGVLCTEAVTP